MPVVQSGQRRPRGEPRGKDVRVEKNRPGHHPRAAWPSAVYGVILLLAAVAYLILQRAIIRHGGGALAQMIGADLKGRLSPLLYVSGVGLSFVRPWLAELAYALVAVIWLVPDRRIERALAARG